ncbi:MAG: N-6 DNA methylase [Candidatus Diapherotrites archaeon]|nr:N-6 DNA methylase [Candidatus Diapherotrites archaeon]
MSKEAAKQRVQALVEKFQRVSDDGKLKSYSEERTKNEFIEPLFEALGWDMRNERTEEEVIKEQRVLRGRADYAFRLGGVIRFFVEAKGVKVDLGNPEFAKQAIAYGFNKGVTWAVLTDFEGLKVFNCEWNETNIWRNQVFELRYTQYLDEFDKLWHLSKEGFERNSLVDYATTVGKRTPRKSVSELLLTELLIWREALSKDIKKAHPDRYSQEEIDEIVQRLIDRLIFIRACEDRQIEGNKLKEAVNAHREKGRSLSRELKEIFSYYREGYDSKLFGRTADEEHEADKVAISDHVLDGVINTLYDSKDGNVRYDFALIDSDVLGNVYEQYLGTVLQTTAKRAKLTEGKSHRKAQGIYYTPTYIVDYIVKNTLGELIKKKKPADVDKIRVLDPACGSGSFLIKAFDVLDDYYAKNDKSYAQSKLGGDGARITKKIEILKNNIYGVDLDEKAVEIAQLNLLLKMAEKRHLLPSLEGSIKNGNSLIDDPAVAEDKAFDWNKQFEDVMKEGGFDVVIGNPPYIRIQTLNKPDVDYFNRNYETPTKNYDIYILFIEKAFKLLKNGGVMGFILPHKFFQGEMGEKLRYFIRKNNALYKIVDFGTNQVFEDASTYTCLLFLSKSQNKTFLYKKFELGDNFRKLYDLKFDSIAANRLQESMWNFSNERIQNILLKIKSAPDNFPIITKKIFKGSSTGDDSIFLLEPYGETKDTYIVLSKKLGEKVELEKDLLKPFVYGEDIRRYSPIAHKKLLLFPYQHVNRKIQLIPANILRSKYPHAWEYLLKVKNDLSKRKIDTTDEDFYKYSAGRSLAEYQQPKIMIPDMLVDNRISYDVKGEFYHGPAIHSIVFNERGLKLHSNFYLGILNSKLFWFFISHTSTALRGNAYRLTPEFVDKFCFPSIDHMQTKHRGIYEKLLVLVKDILNQSTTLSKLGDKQTDERKHLESEIAETDKKIDKLVYELYGLTDDEIKVVENAMK